MLLDLHYIDRLYVSKSDILDPIYEITSVFVGQWNFSLTPYNFMPCFDVNFFSDDILLIGPKMSDLDTYCFQK